MSHLHFDLLSNRAVQVLQKRSPRPGNLLFSEIRRIARTDMWAKIHPLLALHLSRRS
jgi:hypothetical protein